METIETSASLRDHCQVMMVNHERTFLLDEAPPISDIVAAVKSISK